MIYTGTVSKIVQGIDKVINVNICGIRHAVLVDTRSPARYALFFIWALQDILLDRSPSLC